MDDHRPIARSSLVAALSQCAQGSVRARARRFLLGLSADELQFIAEFLGTCILAASEDMPSAAESVQLREFTLASPGKQRIDREDKIIVLREFLHHSGCHLPVSGPAVY